MHGVGTTECHTMIVRKHIAVLGQRKIAEDGRNCVRGSNERDESREKKIRESTEMLRMAVFTTGQSVRPEGRTRNYGS